MTDLTFHHTGVVCDALATDEPAFLAMGFAPEGPPFEDAVQGIRGRFLVGGGTRIELLEDLPGSTTLAPWRKARVRFYHQGYLTADMDAALDRLRAVRGIVIRPPLPAVAFGGRRVAFVMLPGMLCIELIERS